MRLCVCWENILKMESASSLFVQRMRVVKLRQTTVKNTNVKTNTKRLVVQIVVCVFPCVVALCLTCARAAAWVSAACFPPLLVCSGCTVPNPNNPAVRRHCGVFPASHNLRLHTEFSCIYLLERGQTPPHHYAERHSNHIGAAIEYVLTGDDCSRPCHQIPHWCSGACSRTHMSLS